MAVSAAAPLASESLEKLSSCRLAVQGKMMLTGLRLAFCGSLYYRVESYLKKLRLSKECIDYIGREFHCLSLFT